MLPLNVTAAPRLPGLGDSIADPIATAANMTWEILQILTGTYIFSILALFGIPSIVIAGLVIIYSMLLFRALIGYLRGI